MRVPERVKAQIGGKMQAFLEVGEDVRHSGQCHRLCLVSQGAKDIVLFLDILPTAKAGGFLDTDGICLLKCRSYDTSPKKVDAPTFKMFIAAFRSRS